MILKGAGAFLSLGMSHGVTAGDFLDLDIVLFSPNRVPRAQRYDKLPARLALDVIVSLSTWCFL